MRSHEENRRKVCLLCFRKATTSKPIHETLKPAIAEHFIPQYSEHDTIYPKVLCLSCYAVIYRCLKGQIPRDFHVYDYTKLQPLKTRSTSDHNTCKLCQVARETIFPKRPKKISKPRKVSVKICKKCLFATAPGKAHKCSRQTKLQNISKLAEDCHDQFAAKIIRKKLFTGDGSLSFSNERGKRTRLQIVKSGSEKHGGSIKEYSHDEMLAIKADLNLSMKKVRVFKIEMRMFNVLYVKFSTDDKVGQKSS